MTRMTRMACMSHTEARMARWLADLADPQLFSFTARNENTNCLFVSAG